MQGGGIPLWLIITRSRILRKRRGGAVRELGGPPHPLRVWGDYGGESVRGEVEDGYLAGYTPPASGHANGGEGAF